jgi:dTDP-4-dehydrorhamnose 3,5-epimerase-like enzyme
VRLGCHVEPSFFCRNKKFIDPRILGQGSSSPVAIYATTPITVGKTLKIKRTKLQVLPKIEDARGSLSFAEIDQHIPFTPKRYFLIHQVPNKQVRGEHAHKTLDQFLVCLQGSCDLILDDGVVKDQVLLNTPYLGLYIPRMVWTAQYNYSKDAILLVLASEIYRAEDYIRDYETFLTLLGISPC